MWIEQDGVDVEVGRSARVERVAALMKGKGFAFKLYTRRSVDGRARVHDIFVEVGGHRIPYAFPGDKDPLKMLDHVVELAGASYT